MAPEYKKFTVLDHPMIKRDVTLLRDKNYKAGVI